MASSIALCAAHVGAEPLVARDLLRRAKTVLQLVDKDKGSTICTGGLISDISTYLAAPVAAQPDLTQQTLDDVMAGIPARDAEIEALRKEIDTLRAQQEADKVDEERKNTDVIRMLCETLDLARTCHSAMLMSDPPQEMWKARGVDQAIGKALHAADYHRMIGEAHDAARKEQA